MRSARERWHDLVEQWRSSGQTARQFAAVRGINASTLSHWAWRLGHGSGSGSEAPSAHLPALIEVHARPSSDDRFEIELGSRRVRVPASFDADALGRLLAVLEGTS